MNTSRTALLSRLLWAAPCSLVGCVLGGGMLLFGGSIRRVGHTLEVGLAREQTLVPCWASRRRFGAITLGQVILGQSHELLARLRVHEQVHVRQYERLGFLFFLAYPAASLVAWLQGQCPYLGNRFEKEAIAQASVQMTV